VSSYFGATGAGTTPNVDRSAMPRADVRPLGGSFRNAPCPPSKPPDFMRLNRSVRPAPLDALLASAATSAGATPPTAACTLL